MWFMVGPGHGTVYFGGGLTAYPPEQQHSEDITTEVPPRATPLHSGAVSPCHASWRLAVAGPAPWMILP